MKELAIVGYWCAGGHGHDSGEIEDTINLSDEEFEVFKELEAYEEELDNISDPRLKDICIDKYNDVIDTMYDYLADEGMLDCYEESCSTINKESGEKEYTKEPFEYFMDVYCPGVRFNVDEYDFLEDED